MIRYHLIANSALPVHSSSSLGRSAVLCLFLGVLAAAAWTDGKTRTIPDKLVLAALGISLLSIPLFPEIGVPDRLLGMCSASLLLLVITLCVPGAFGGGDMKLMAACGVFLGWRYSLLALGIAVVFGAAYGLVILAAGRADRKSQIAFGPFLCTGMAAAIFFGEQILALLF